MVNRSRAMVSVVFVLVALVLMATLASAATFRVRARFIDNDYRWRPKTLEVPTGSRVVWRIVEGTHNVRSIGSNWSKSSGNIAEGGSTSFRFDSRGTYRYRCTLHSELSSGTCTGMCGRVLVS